MLLQSIGERWTAVHARDWLDVASMAIGWLVLGAFALAAAVALVRGRRYRAIGVLSDDERRELVDRIAKVERTTSGEVAVVVLEASDDHPQAAWLAASLCALAATLALGPWLEGLHASTVFAAHVVAGALAYVATRALPDLRRRLVGDARAEEMAEEQALQEFARLGVHRTADRTGVLILVSLLEHAVVVLADDGVAAKVAPERWAQADRAVIEGVARGSLADGLRAGIEQVGSVLAEHFPRTADDRDELPSHLIVRRR